MPGCRVVTVYSTYCYYSGKAAMLIDAESLGNKCWVPAEGETSFTRTCTSTLTMAPVLWMPNSPGEGTREYT